MPPHSISLKPFDPETDFAFLYEVYAGTRREEFQIIDWPQEQIEELLKMQFHAQHTFYHQSWPDAQYLVISTDGKKIGRLYKDYREDEIRVIDIALLPEHRNKGVGGVLMREILNEAGERNLFVRIHVEKNNPAMRFYHRLGFVKVGGTEVYDLMEHPPS